MIRATQTWNQDSRTQAPRWPWIAIVLFALALALVSRVTGWNRFTESQQNLFTRSELARAISASPGNLVDQEARQLAGLPSKIDLPPGGPASEALVQYSLDAGLQVSVEAIFQQYRPDHGAFAAVDPSTGRVLALVSYERDARKDGAPTELGRNLALRATFPSASVFKVVTASAAIAEQKFTADTRIAFNGSNHTLYRSNVLKTSNNRWTRSLSLREAFAHSVNTVFGRIGAFNLGAAKLRDYADRFGFNRQIASDLPVQPGRVMLQSDADPWSLAETASGFTRETTMSPLQGALIAAALVNGGKMMTPYAVESIHLQDGDKIYQARPEIAAEVVSHGVASEVMELMRQTVVSGTSRKSFRGFSRGPTSIIDVGGKTGSLTGMDPIGKYDWFVGFGKIGDKAIALAALTIHREQWRVKSSYVARKAIERYLLGD